MRLLISEIVAPDLSEYDCSDIKAGIQEAGLLLHPITVRARDNGTTELVAGKKRLKAMIELGYKEIEVVYTDSELSNREISLTENLRRANLPWYEKIELEAELHQIRIDQHGKATLGCKATGWTQRDTARELKMAIGVFNEDLFLATAIKRNPHLKTIQDRSTALRLVKEAAKREQMESESLMVDMVDWADQVYCGDSLEILREMPDKTFHVCVTDPPWTEYKDESLVRDESTIAVFAQVYRVLKSDALLYAVVSTGDFYLYREELPKFGFRVQEYPLIWVKSGVLSHGRRPWEYARDYEPIIVAAKGDPVLATGVQLSAVLKYDPIHSTKLVHPNEKPIGLFKQLIGDSTFDGAIVLDPFGGSGATAVAARELGRSFTTIEREWKYYQQIRKRLGL